MEPRARVVEFCNQERKWAGLIWFLALVSSPNLVLKLLKTYPGSGPTLLLAILLLFFTVYLLLRRVELTDDQLRIRRPLLNWLGLKGTEIPLERLSGAQFQYDPRLEFDRLSLTGAELERPPVVSADFLRALNARIEAARGGRSAQIAESLHALPGAELRCPYCRDGLQDGLECTSCHTPQHADCAAEHGRCVTLGCDARIAA